ncbi:MAG TPA: thio(seleno)oxazole modification radical SAM maturase SbtM, partial [Desulfurivibrionaceae bacterium]|nr:thio(seleno)oxazole modification radical SAM maturase SbtM [Desulfurivibrionaceae bacterium]
QRIAAQREEPMTPPAWEKIYPACRRLVPSGLWCQLTAGDDPARLPQALGAVDAAELPSFLPDLARLEWAIHQVREGAVAIDPVAALALNPTLQMLEFPWQGLAGAIGGGAATPAPRPGPERLLVWWAPADGVARCRPASDEDLLVLKVVVEGIDPREAAALGGVPVGAIDNALRRAVERGLLLAPPSRLRRDEAMFPVAGVAAERLVAQVFTLQWHITQACDLHCKHCYDRSSRPQVSLAQGIAVLDDLRDFCRDRQVIGQVSFTGGNPLLHPEFLALYRAAAERGLVAAILGNPASREQLQKIVAIQQPAFFQVSLEGLAAHNDAIRGQGHFHRVIAFLELLKEFDIYSMVMLTLTRANLPEVLPLAELLRDKVDLFTFNRLAMVGEGAQLVSVRPEEYPAFLADYLAAAAENPVLSLKDNLLNLVRHQQGLPLFGGCTGYGCGAAFNFLSLLSDGEAHACRKFPSPIGNLHRQRLSEVYDGAADSTYRAGSLACRACAIRPNCGGCLAVAYGFGRDVARERDPYCFLPAAG